MNEFLYRKLLSVLCYINFDTLQLFMFWSSLILWLQTNSFLSILVGLWISEFPHQLIDKLVITTYKKRRKQKLLFSTFLVSWVSFRLNGFCWLSNTLTYSECSLEDYWSSDLHTEELTTIFELVTNEQRFWVHSLVQLDCQFL